MWLHSKSEGNKVLIRIRATTSELAARSRQGFSSAGRSLVGEGAISRRDAEASGRDD